MLCSMYSTILIHNILVPSLTSMSLSCAIIAACILPNASWLTRHQIHGRLAKVLYGTSDMFSHLLCHIHTITQLETASSSNISTCSPPMFHDCTYKASRIDHAIHFSLFSSLCHGLLNLSSARLNLTWKKAWFLIPYPWLNRLHLLKFFHTLANFNTFHS